MTSLMDPSPSEPSAVGIGSALDLLAAYVVVPV
jgi:hypothetical protein